MDPAARSEAFWSASLPEDGSRPPPWSRVAMVAMLIGLAGAIAGELYRSAQIARAFAAIRDAGAVYAQDDESPGGPIVSIDLDSFLVDDAGRAHRKGHATDQVLARLVRFDRLRDLSLERADLTDAGLAYLTGLKALRSLNLRGTPITDAGVPHLARCVGLRRIDLSRTRVTREGEGLLRRALPAADIVRGASRNARRDDGSDGVDAAADPG